MVLFIDFRSSGSSLHHNVPGTQRRERAAPSQIHKLSFQSQSLTRPLNVLDLNWPVFLLLTLIGQEEPHGPTQPQIVPGR